MDIYTAIGNIETESEIKREKRETVSGGRAPERLFAADCTSMKTVFSKSLGTRRGGGEREGR